MADKTPAEIIAEARATRVSLAVPAVYPHALEDARPGAQADIAALEAAGYRIVAAVEPADELISAAAQSLCFSRNGDIEQWINYRGDALDAILDALAAAPTWGGKE